MANKTPKKQKWSITLASSADCADDRDDWYGWMWMTPSTEEVVAGSNDDDEDALEEEEEDEDALTE